MGLLQIQVGEFRDGTLRFALYHGPASVLQETEGDRHYNKEEKQVQNEVHSVGRGVSNGRWKYLVRSLKKLLIVQSALIRTEYPWYPPTLNLKHSPDAITNQSYPHQPNPTLPNGQGEEQNRE